MICKNHRLKTFLYAVLPALCFILPLFYSCSASATDSGTVYLNADSGTRSYESPPGTYISAQNFITSATPTPIQLLGSANNNTLFGYNIGSSIDNVGIQWGPYTSLQISWKVGNRAGYSLYNWWLSDYDSKCLVYFNYQGDYVVSDAFVTDDIYDKTYTCNIQLPEGKRPIGIDVRNGSWRTASSSIQGIAYTSSIVTAASHEPIMFKELKLTYETGENPQTALLGEIAGLSQQQIQQNQQMIDQQNQQYNYLTDTTAPSADTSVLSDSAGWLPAGPVDSILTLPISLLNGIIGVFSGNQQCSAINLPLPFLNSTLPLPCVGPILNDIGIAPLWNVLGGIIGAFIIWDTLKWLYKFIDDTLSIRENESSIWGGL